MNNKQHDIIPLGLSFDDVLLVPQFSDISSRSHVSTTSPLVKGINLSTPLISANMDTVTMAAMAITMAKVGGIGFIHRFLTIEEEANEVEKVKRYRSHVVANPYRIDSQQTVEAAQTLMNTNNVGGLIVTNQNNNLLGLVTRRDIHGKNSLSLVSEVMTPKEKLHIGNKDTTPEEAQKIMYDNRVEKLPLLDSDKLVGLIVMKDLQKLEAYPNATLDAKGRLAVVAAVGVVNDYIERAKELEKVGADALVLDIAHAHASHAGNALKELKKHTALPIIAGNVATGEGAAYLAKNGADAIKCGVGPGAACITRMVAGAGVPQLTAIIDTARACKKAGVPCIADGGIKRGGDFAKAIAAGAETAMIGSALAGTTEAPGKIEERNGQLVKTYRGMASLDAFKEKQAAEGKIDANAAEAYVAEGVSSVVPYLHQSAESIINNLVGGLRSGMTYSSSKTVSEFHTNAKFVRQTQSGLAESNPHILNRF